jgi:hypothetical protein
MFAQGGKITCPEINIFFNKKNKKNRTVTEHQTLWRKKKKKNSNASRSKLPDHARTVGRPCD